LHQQFYFVKLAFFLNLYSKLMPSQIVLNANKQAKVLQGHPWVFPHAIKQIKGQVHAGDWVEVYSAEGKKIGGGFYNPNSLYRVRMVASSQLLESYSNWVDVVDYRIRQAKRKREQLGLPNPKNTGYRLLNSEADGLSGLVIDVFNDILVISSTAYWTELYRELIQNKIQKQFQNFRQVWFGQVKPLAQDGWQTPHRDCPKSLETEILEAGVKFAIQFDQVQKTGIYLDQRENHARLAPLCQNKRVLDLYTYHGGFALHAAKAGASYVRAVDSSQAAIEHGQRNANLNQVKVDWQLGDAKEHLASAKDFDIIILDPPKLVPSKKDLPRAKKLYRYLHREIFKAMQPGSLLLTCNCSSALSVQEFTQLIAQEAHLEGRVLQILGTYGPAICHPSLNIFPEGQYLSAILVTLL
jgi:23S rRNA (cytosine1962-C5)-methyltransferase